jgi:hypothetical protein
MYCAIKRCRRSQNERHGPRRAKAFKRPLPPEHDGPHHRGQGCGWHMISRPLRGRLQQTSEHVQQLRKRPLPPEHDGPHHQRLIRVDSFDLNLGGPKTPNELFCTNFRFVILTTVPHLPAERSRSLLSKPAGSILLQFSFVFQSPPSLGKSWSLMMSLHELIPPPLPRGGKAQPPPPPPPPPLCLLFLNGEFNHNARAKDLASQALAHLFAF